jgi:hypothetical protein
MQKLLIVLVLSTAFFSCKSGKLQRKSVELGKSDSTSIAGFQLDEVVFKQLRFKSDVDVVSAQFSRKVPLTLQLQKDQMIWGSISIGLELGRLKITPDSIQVMDRFNRRAYVGTWEELRKSTEMDLNFSLLQAVLTGGMPFPVESKDVLQAEGNSWTVIQERDEKRFRSKIDPTEHKPFEVLGEDPKTASTLSLHYKHFVREKDQLLPSLISLVLGGKNTASLEITHTRIEVLEEGLNFSFQIPSSYKIERLPGL